MIITPFQIIELVADEYKIEPAQITSPNRSALLAEARHASVWLMTKQACLGNGVICQAIGYADHTSCYHAVAKVNGMIECDPEFKKRIERLSSGVAFLEQVSDFDVKDVLGLAEAVAAHRRAVAGLSVNEIRAVGHVLSQCWEILLIAEALISGDFEDEPTREALGGAFLSEMAALRGETKEA